MLYSRLFTLLMVLSGCAGAMQQNAPVAPDIDVQHYDLTLRVEPEAEVVYGKAQLLVRHATSTDQLILYLTALDVDSVWVDDALVTFQHEAGRIVVPVAVGTDSSRIDVHYHGTPREGLYVDDRFGQRIVYTDSWPERARGWIPSVDHPSDPATVALTLDLPLGYEVVANGRMQAVDTVGSRVRSAWTLDTPVPTYTFAFAAAEAYTVVEDSSAGPVEIRYVLIPQDVERALALYRTPQVIEFFSETIGPYPFPTYTVVQAPIRYGGMENAALPFLSADLYRSDATGRRLESVNVHEAVHQWFGDRVPIQDWRHLWLSEGFATYLTTVFYEDADGPDEARQRRVQMAAFTPSDARSHRPLVPADPVEPNAFLTWVPYRKGGCVLHLIRLRIGDDAFFEALRTVYRTRAGEPFTTEEFKSVLESHTSVDLGPIFTYWVYNDQLPELQVEWNEDDRRLSWTIEGDSGTLTDVPFELQVRQGDEVRYVAASEGEVILPGTEQPEVRSVGILMTLSP